MNRRDVKIHGNDGVERVSSTMVDEVGAGWYFVSRD